MDYFIIDKDYMKSNVDSFITIIKTEPNEYWSDIHYLKDLKGKWDYSVGIKSSNILVAFIIASIKEDSIHIHKFMVREGFRSQGIGKKLLDYFIEFVSRSFNSITLKVYKDNFRAIDFYTSNGFIKINASESDLVEMIKDIR